MKIGNNLPLKILNFTIFCIIIILYFTIDLKRYIEPEKLRTGIIVGSLIVLILAAIKNKIYLLIFLSLILAFLLTLILF